MDLEFVHSLALMSACRFGQLNFANLTLTLICELYISLMPIVVTQQAVQKIVSTLAQNIFPPADFLNLPWSKVKINFGEKRERKWRGWGWGRGEKGEGHPARYQNKVP